MSCYYWVYAEAFVNGTWVCIDPLVKRIKNNDYCLVPTFFSGSRSYFEETFDELKRIGSSIKATELSPELAEELSAFNDDENESMQKFSFKLYSIPYHSLTEAAKPDRFMHHGWVSKDDIALYELGEIEELWPLSLEDVERINDDAKACLLKGYEYREWDNPYDYLYNFKHIKERVDMRIQDFMDCNYAFEQPEVRLITHSDW